MNEKVDLKMKLITGPGNQYEDVEIPVYLQNFKWDTVQYQFDKTLEWMGLKVQKETKSGEDKVKQQVEKIQAIKQKFNSLAKKSDGNFNNCDLSDVVYDNVQKIKAN